MACKVDRRSQSVGSVARVRDFFYLYPESWAKPYCTCAEQKLVLFTYLFILGTGSLFEDHISVLILLSLLSP